MAKVLACRVLAPELDSLGGEIEVDYFEPKCHRLSSKGFVEYVRSRIGGHDALVCGDCGGLAEVAREAGLPIPEASDCIDLVVDNLQLEDDVIFITNGWLQCLPQIFGLVRLDAAAREKVIPKLFSGINKVIYVRDPKLPDRQCEAAELARMIGAEVEVTEGSTRRLAEYLDEVQP